jgi:hypothetical protein
MRQSRFILSILSLASIWFIAAMSRISESQNLRVALYVILNIV